MTRMRLAPMRRQAAYCGDAAVNSGTSNSESTIRDGSGP
jgi:hypothetical protein